MWEHIESFKRMDEMFRQSTKWVGQKEFNGAQEQIRRKCLYFTGGIGSIEKKIPLCFNINYFSFVFNLFKLK